MICVDFFVDEPKKWMKKYNPKLVHGPHGNYYTIKTTARYARRAIRHANWDGIKTRHYNEMMARSSDYRENFFQAYNPPYRCCYCHKKLTKSSLVVDHVIPVAKAKSTLFARFLLKIQGISTVNDVRNLVPACRKCNSKKSDKMGLWFIRGKLGVHHWFWIARNITIVFIVFLIIFFCISTFTDLMDSSLITYIGSILYG